jgi:hypothetical protein
MANKGPTSNFPSHDEADHADSASKQQQQLSSYFDSEQGAFVSAHEGSLNASHCASIAVPVQSKPIDFTF